MSCQACTKSYGFFTKESGCPNCGFSFCTKCLKKEIQVPKCNGMKLKVCPRCFEKLENLQRSEELVQGVQKFSRSEILKTPGSSIFDLEDPAPEELGPILQPINPKLAVPEDDDAISQNLDSIISKRLKNLKDDGNNKLPSDLEISSRLADLKGLPQKTYKNSDLLVSKDQRTDREKIDDLLKQFVGEASIDNNVVFTSNPIEEIEKRLAALRGSEYKPQTDNTPSDNEIEIDEEEAASRIVNRFLEEVNLPNVPIDENEQELLAGLPKPSEETEELPWCTICNEDAIVRCKGCDGELFCRTCFKEIHDDEEYRNHSTEAYSAPPKFKENHF